MEATEKASVNLIEAANSLDSSLKKLRQLIKAQHGLANAYTLWVTVKSCQVMPIFY
jgi:hypothetical protein